MTAQQLVDLAVTFKDMDEYEIARILSKLEFDAQDEAIAKYSERLAAA